MAELTVTVASHHFKVNQISVRGREAVDKFARQYIQYSLQRVYGQYVKTASKVFAAATADRTEYRFHINQLPAFQAHLKHFWITEEMVNLKILGFRGARKVDLRIRDGWAERPHQIPAVAYLMDEEPKSKLLGIQTGQGKSFCSMSAASKIAELPIFVVAAKYLDKWVIDIRKTYDLDVDDLMVIRGKNQLQAFIHLAMEGDLPSKVLLISTKTLQNWITLYEKVGDNTLLMGYPCRPDEFYECTGIGIRISDEVHQEFHLGFKIDLYTHVKKAWGMSASMKGDDHFLNQMYEVSYPFKDRFLGDPYIKYISSTSIIYRFAEPDKIQSISPQQRTYSHHLFEESLMKNKGMLANYVQMISDIVYGELLADRRTGERMIIYAAGVEFCTYLVKEMRKHFPSLVISRYCGSENDPYEDLMDSDLTVTTLGSAGTNVDIPMLKCVLLTTAVMSTQSNIQGFGRLRNNLPDGRVSRFVWIVNQDNKKHVEYHERKIEILTDKAMTLNSQDYGRLL
jgi:hypothetical protein